MTMVGEETGEAERAERRANSDKKRRLNIAKFM